jgi:nucleoside-diphosphate-sugar epimerase
VGTPRYRRILKHGLGDAGRRVPTRNLPSFLLRLLGLFDRQIAVILPELGKRKDATNEKARRRLGWTPLAVKESVLATAKGLTSLGLVR